MAFCPPLPLYDIHIVELSDKEIKEITSQFSRENFLSGKVKSDDMIIYSTACWRQYVGTWEIKDGRLYLVGLKGRFKYVGDEPLFADWFTGVLRIPRGENIIYVHMGFGSVYEKELHVKVENGVVTNTRIVDNRAKKYDEDQISWDNLPGNENRFPGDDEM